MFPFRKTFVSLESKGKKKYRKVVFYKNYFQKFFDNQSQKVRAKIIWTLELLEDLPRVPANYLRSLENTNGLYEVRVQVGNDIFRIFCFFDPKSSIIIANAFQKKSQKTPMREIEKALKIKADYENEK